MALLDLKEPAMVRKAKTGIIPLDVYFDYQ